MKIGEWMLVKGFDDSEVGRRLNVDRTTVSRIRRGIQRPRWDLLPRIISMTDGAVKSEDFLSEAAE